MPPPSPESVKRHLAFRILALARQVAPDGRVAGREWEGHGPDGSKWGIVIAGDKVGKWQNFGSGVAGTSGLSLIRDAFCGGDHIAAWHWALDWLGEAAERAPPATAAPVRPDRTKARNASAIGMFLHARPFDWDGPVGWYLVGRGIDPACFDDRPIGALRFHPNCWNVEAQAYLPAMVAAVIDPLTRIHIATHRTWLTGAGRRWSKARLETPKKALGPGLGGVIPLTRGASGRSLAAAPAGDCALLGEGIENTLTVAQWHDERRAMAYVSAGNLAALDLPEAIADILLILDRDGENHAVTQVRRDTAAHWIDEGRMVALWEPPAGHKDANAYWLAEMEATR
jgi:Toprim domain